VSFRCETLLQRGRQLVFVFGKQDAHLLTLAGSGHHRLRACQKSDRIVSVAPSARVPETV
jgi:hypothetical protein